MTKLVLVMQGTYLVGKARKRLLYYSYHVYLLKRPWLLHNATCYPLASCLSLIMVGKQQLSPASGTFSLLGKMVPTTNFYRQLKQAFELSFLYELVAPYYGKCGHQSIDSVLFFKLMLVEHLENLSSDRALIRHCQMRLDILFFLDHALEQPLPWHSTLSRIRQRLPDKVFDECFQYSLNQCAQTGLVDGQIQAIDAAYVEANASLDTLEAKKIANWTLDVNQEAVQPAPDEDVFCEG